MMYGKNIIAKIKELNLSKGKFIVVGGSSLAVRGIRETKDIDIVVTQDLFDKLSKENWLYDTEYECKWNRKRLKSDDVEIYPDLYFENKKFFADVGQLIESADFIEDIPFQPLEHLVICKLDIAREKDLRDIELIKKYLNSKI